MGFQIQILRADCFLQLFPGFSFGFYVKTLRCQLTCLKCVQTCTIQIAIIFSKVEPTQK